MAQTKRRRSVRPRGVRLADRVQRALDGGVDRVEGIHKRVAGFPLEIMEQLQLFEETVKNLHEIQDRSIGAAYDVVRGVNRDVIDLAKQTLKRSEARARSRKHATKRAAPRAAAHEAA